jgi:DNA-binding NarL/FixJ family response regulator
LSREYNVTSLTAFSYERLSTIAKTEGRYEEYVGYLSKYYELESNKLKSFLRQRIDIMDLEIENMRQKKEIELNEYKRSHLEHEIANTALQLLTQTKLLAEFRNEILTIVRKAPPTESVVRELREKLKTLPCESIDWSKFEQQFIAVHPNFKHALSEKYPELTKQELRICQLLRVGMKSFEIGKLICISERGVENHRFNIRKKLGLNTEQPLIKALQEI